MSRQLSALNKGIYYLRWILFAAQMGKACFAQMRREKEERKKHIVYCRWLKPTDIKGMIRGL